MIKQPYNVNAAAQIAALETLKDLDYRQRTIKAILDERERLFIRLAEVKSLESLQSKANFILCQVIGRDAYELKLALEDEGILIRYYRTTRLRDHIRLTVGKPEQTDAVIAALRRI